VCAIGCDQKRVGLVVQSGERRKKGLNGFKPKEEEETVAHA